MSSSPRRQFQYDDNSSDESKYISDKHPSIFPFREEVIDSEILQNMDDYQLQKACRLDKRLNKLCNNEEFWRQRLISRLGYDVNLRKMGNKYKQAYIELSRYFDDLQDLARMGAKYGYIEVVLNSLDSVASLVFNDVSSYPSSNFGTARSEFAEIVRATYQCAISTGSINIMAHLEDKYKVTIGDIAEMTDLRFICDTVDAKSVDYLINKYGIVWPRNQIYIFAVASGDLDLMDLLVDNGVALPIFYPRMLISAIISGFIPMFERVLELYDHRPINYDIMTHITNCSRINTKDRMAVYEKLLNKLNDTDYYRFMEQFVDNIVLNYSSNRLLLYLLEKGHYMPIKPIKRLVSNLKQRVRYWEEEGKSAEVSEANELIEKLTNS